jgi:hypothetical protein
MHLSTSFFLYIAVLVTAVAARPSRSEDDLDKRFSFLTEESKEGDTCQSIAARHRTVTIDDLRENNPAYVAPSIPIGRC